MTKLEQAARQTLEALEEYQAGNRTEFFGAITALREALAEPELNLNCKSVQKRLATVWGYVKAEQVKQEPVAWLWVSEHGSERLEWESVENTSKWKSTPLYAAPVRTKDPCHPWQDLTDDEISKIWDDSSYGDSGIDFARAVIAADRAKNNLCERTK